MLRDILLAKFQLRINTTLPYHTHAIGVSPESLWGGVHRGGNGSGGPDALSGSNAPPPATIRDSRWQRPRPEKTRSEDGGSKSLPIVTVWSPKWAATKQTRQLRFLENTSRKGHSSKHQILCKPNKPLCFGKNQRSVD